MRGEVDKLAEKKAMLMKKILVYFMLITFVSVGCREKNSALEVFKTDDGAINGYDPVSYHQEKPVKGTEEHSYQWKDATWYFANEENLSLFKADPERYAPQYGGYCAYGMAEGHKAPTQPDAWTIVGDKLYFNYNKDVLTQWRENRDEFIKKAEDNWPTVSDDPF
jgi:YHS domain-containing protein